MRTLRSHTVDYIYLITIIHLVLRFSDNPLVAVLGRQVSGAPVEGFPDGLPEFTPKGVRITLENMIGDTVWKYFPSKHRYFCGPQVLTARW